MADMTEIPDDSRRKLPPISPRSKIANDSTTSDKPIKKKKKRTREENGSSVEEKSDRPTRKRSPQNVPADADGTDVVKDTTDPSENAVRKPKRAKRKQAIESDAGEQTPQSDETPRSGLKPRNKRTAGSKQDVSGSKTSLLSKDEEGTTPSVKTKLKKKKKKAQKVVDEEDYTNSGLAAELTSIEDDVLALDETLPQEETVVQHPNSMAAITLKSQPTNKIFVETNSGFKGQNKMKVARRLAEEKTRPLEIEEPTTSTSIEFALRTHRILKTFFLFCHGITAGLALWHIVIVYVLSYHPREDFLVHYQPMALPVQCLFYILLVCCTISAFDRHDISYPTRRFLRQAFTLQSGAVSVPIYLIALVFSVVIAAEADRINLYYAAPDLWENDQVSDHELNVWKSLNTVRGVLSVLGWFVLSLTPNTDRLSKNLGAGGDFLDTNVEMLSVNKNSIVP